MREHLVSAACACVIAIAMSATAAAQSVQASALAVCVVLSPKLSLNARGTAIVVAELEAIWTPLGVAIHPVQEADEGCDRVVVVKADHEARAEDTSAESALGWVPFVEGRARQLVFLRVSRSRLLVGALSPGTRPEGLTDLLFARLVGRSLAHELGHVLMNSMRHEESGLMRARYRAGDVLGVPTSAYTLNASERIRLFTQVTGEARLAVRQ
jgi:hypothetical protein